MTKTGDDSILAKGEVKDLSTDRLKIKGVLQHQSAIKSKSLNKDCSAVDRELRSFGGVKIAFSLVNSLSKLLTSSMCFWNNRTFKHHHQRLTSRDANAICQEPHSPLYGTEAVWDNSLLTKWNLVMWQFCLFALAGGAFRHQILIMLIHSLPWW